MLGRGREGCGCCPPGMPSRANVDTWKWLVARGAVPVDLEAAGLGHLSLAPLTMQPFSSRAVAQPAWHEV